MSHSHNTTFCVLTIQYYFFQVLPCTFCEHGLSVPFHSSKGSFPIAGPRLHPPGWHRACTSRDALITPLHSDLGERRGMNIHLELLEACWEAECKALGKSLPSTSSCTALLQRAQDSGAIPLESKKFVPVHEPLLLNRSLRIIWLSACERRCAVIQMLS